jgi:hypothetical protein
MTSVNLVRWGGFAAISGGVIQTTNSVVFIFQTAHPESNLSEPLLIGTLNVLEASGVLLIAVGLMGLYTLLGTNSRTGTMGLILAWLSTTAFVSLTVYDLSSAPQYQSGSPFSLITGSLMYWTSIIGVILLGVATLRARLLGRWSALPLAPGLLLGLLSPLLTFFLYSDDSTKNGVEGVLGTGLFALPFILSGGCWILLGYMLSYQGKRLTVRYLDEPKK